MVRIYLTPSENAVREQNNADFLLLVTLNQTSIGRCGFARSTIQCNAATINWLLRDEFFDYRAHIFRKDVPWHP